MCPNTLNIARQGKGYDNEKRGLKCEKNGQDHGEPPRAGLQIILNADNPETAFSSGQLPNAKAVLKYGTPDGENGALENQLERGCPCPKEFYINKTVEELATFVASVYPKRVSRMRSTP